VLLRWTPLRGGLTNAYATRDAVAETSGHGHAQATANGHPAASANGQTAADSHARPDSHGATR
jgi:hypothetical protein